MVVYKHVHISFIQWVWPIDCYMYLHVLHSCLVGVANFSWLHTSTLYVWTGHEVHAHLPWPRTCSILLDMCGECVQ